MSGRASQQRRAAAIRDELAAVIATEVKDPRVHAAGLVGVSRVELNRDGSAARVYVSFVSTEDGPRAEALEGLAAASGFLRSTLGRRLGIGRAPKLTFDWDPTAEVAERLAAVVAEDAMTPFDRAVDVIRRADTILLATHRGPDGDGVGSMVALASLLRSQGKTPTLFTEDLVPRNLKWLPFARSFVRTLAADARFDATIVVDCGDPQLLGPGFPAPEVTGTVVALDHHASHRPFGDVFVSDPDAACVGVLVARIARRLGWRISKEAAQGLFVSLVADTGSFSYSNANAEAFHLAAELVGAGYVDPWAIHERMNENVPVSRYRLLAAALGTLELAADGRLAFLQITEQMLADVKASWEDSEGVVNYARGIAGVECGVLLTPAKGGGVRVSMRSKGRAIDAGAVCARLGGGGHRGAAGCTLPGDLPTARRVVEDALVAALEGAVPSAE